jgi:predicted DNA binding CopG/RHH family protein
MKHSKKKRTKSQALLDKELDQEFEAVDLSQLKEHGVQPQLVRPKEKLTSIFLPPTLIERLKAKGAKRGIGYQTMLKIIVHENVEKY